MEAKWPFLMLTIALLAALGAMIVSIDRVNIMNQWSDNRCTIPVMFAASFFKPEEDSRTTSEFASDNFSFCMKQRVDAFMEIMMTPVVALFSKHVAVAGNVTDSMNAFRSITQTMYNAFSGYFEKFYRRFNATVFEISKVVQFLRMAMRRISGIMMSFIYMGITIFDGIINTIQFIIKVILIIFAILLAIIILLFFILFPIIPGILFALAVIVSSVVALAGYMSPDIANTANSQKSGFCFAEWTMIPLANHTYVSVTDIKVGDQLADGSYITATIVMDGSDVQLYQVTHGATVIHISGSHLIKGTDHIWKSVMMDERAITSDRTSDRVYCFNTTTNVIAIDGLFFRDWEEIANHDTKGQMIWNYMVSSMINKGVPFSVWKENLKDYVNSAVMSSYTMVKTSTGFVPIHTIQIGDLILDKENDLQEVRGIIRGEVECDITDSVWKTELYEYDMTKKVWLKGKATVKYGATKTEGWSLITESGDFIILDDVKKEIAVRDFTEVGYHAIHLTYPYVDARLRINE
jgi:hypothetical protein